MSYSYRQRLRFTPTTGSLHTTALYLIPVKAFTDGNVQLCVYYMHLFQFCQAPAASRQHGRHSAAFRRRISGYVANPTVRTKTEERDKDLKDLIDSRKEKHDRSGNMPHKRTQRAKRNHDQPAADEIYVQHKINVSRSPDAEDR